MSSALDSIFDLGSDISELSSPPASPVAPPSFYPSPPPSENSSLSSSQSTAASTQDEHAPTTPKKKHRKAEPQPRTTKYLDLTLDEQDRDQSAQDLMLKTLRKKRKIVVIAGAGISVSADIPDFRSSGGLFSTLKKDHKLKSSGKELFDISVYQEASTTSSFHDMVRSLSNKASQAQPTDFHHLLANLAKENRLKRLYTQNIDELETRFPPLKTKVPLAAPWPLTIQLHGGLNTMVCQKCRRTSSLEAERFEGPIPPLCNECESTDEVRVKGGLRSHGVGKLRPRIVLYNEHSPDEDAIGSVMTADLRSRPDALIVVGTTMKIPGVRRIVREMSRVVRGRKDGVTMWINNGSMPSGKDFENCWDLIVKGDSDRVAQEADLMCETTASEVERYIQTQPVSVVVGAEDEKTRSGSGISTPSASQEETSLSSSVADPMEVEQSANLANQRSVNDALFGETNKPTGKSKSRKPAATKSKVQKNRKPTTAPKQPAINQRFSSSKPNVDRPNKPGDDKPDKSPNFTNPASFKLEESPRAMCPIRSGSPRSNGPHPRATPECSSPYMSSQTPPQNENCTISPSGRLPKGFENIIDTGPDNTEREKPGMVDTEMVNS